MTLRASCMGSSNRKLPVPPSSNSTPSGVSSFSRWCMTWTPTPSSPIRTLPMPSTNNLPAASVIAAATHELPSTDHRRSGSAPFNVVMVEDQVHVHDGEQDEEPHHRMVPLPHAEVPTHQRNDPGKHVRQERPAHAGVQREAGS